MALIMSSRRPYGPANKPNQSKTRSADRHRNICTTTAAAPIAAMMEPRITSRRSRVDWTATALQKPQ